MTHAARLRFSLHDEVEFDYRGRVLRGRLVRFNPKNAMVACAPGGLMNVPYSLLRPAPDAKPAGHGRGVSGLQAVESLAAALLRAHGLARWSFRFDDATRRAGLCNAATRTVSMAIEFARTAGDEEIRDTLLHEIAHALVGPRHGHDATWRAKALEIGCSGERCHDVAFSPPRYVVRCSRRCWAARAMKRRSRIVCRRCGGAIEYTRFTEELWLQAQCETGSASDQRETGNDGQPRA